jgi:pilus assembly protein Flp/PilA
LFSRVAKKKERGGKRMREQLMLRLGKVFARFEFKREDGQALVEYGLIIALVALVCIAGLTALGVSINGLLQTIADTVAGVPA